jgi:hypothetical protein
MLEQPQDQEMLLAGEPLLVVGGCGVRLPVESVEDHTRHIG